VSERSLLLPSNFLKQTGILDAYEFAIDKIFQRFLKEKNQDK